MNGSPYLALTWPPAHRALAERLEEIEARLVDEGWSPIGRRPGLSAWARPDLRPLSVSQHGRAILLGDVHCRSGEVFGDSGHERRAAAPRAVAARLASEAWGGFVALLMGDDDRPAALYRDPSGALGCVAWALGDGLHVVASDLTAAPPWLRPRRLALDWNQIGAVVAVPTAVTTAPLFDDMLALGLGEYVQLGAQLAPEPLWRPAAFAEDPLEPAAAREELVRRVDTAVSAVLARHPRVLMELSGGLDSSILAGSIGALGLVDNIGCFLNYRDPRPEADEAGYARAVAARIGAPLTVREMPLEALDEAAFAELGRYATPAIGGADAARDRFEAELLRQTGATAILSGQGGDGVFFQFPTALVLADLLRAQGLSALRSTVWGDLARRTRTSAWQVLREARAANRGRAKMPTVVSTLLRPEWDAVAPRIEHEWVTAAKAAGLPPGKLLHIRAIALTQLYRGPSRRLERAELLLPLFSQPVMELCLRLATPDLAGGSYDRPFARAAFADRLPAAVVARRSKGNLSAHVARSVAASATFLRPYLVDGCLAEAGILDRAKVAQTLDPQSLMMGSGGAAGDILSAAAVEAWVRYWQTQVADAPMGARRRI